MKDSVVGYILFPLSSRNISAFLAISDKLLENLISDVLPD